MSYNPNIPQGTDPILQSAQQIRTNFQQINEAFAKNHVGLTEDADFSGMHRTVILRPQVGDPTTSATQIAIYSKLVSTIPEMFYAPSSSQTPIQMTFPSIQTGIQSTPPDMYFAQQFTFVAGPFVIYGGIIKSPSNGQTITLLPITTLVYVDLIVANASSTSPSAIFMAAPTSIAANSFNISFGTIPGTFDVYYFAIGV